ncbi:MAG: zinc metallopeptidase [Caldilineaceae bacterium]|nr:zinc metallopeptidase [Caldilineaceae bacterium]
MYFSPLYFIFALPALLLGLWAQMRVRSAFAKYSRVRAASGMTGAQAARRILDAVAGTVRTVARLNPLHLLSEDRRDGAKDIGDAHERLGRDALREAVVNFALHLPQESGKSAKWEAGEGDFSDFNDFAPEDSGEIEEPEPFPIHCLPGVAGEMARGVAKSAMVPEVLAGMNVLGILSAAIGAGLEVASGGNRRTRGNLFLMPVAKSGTGKGQSFGPIAEPFLKMEAERVAQWQRTDRPEARADKAVAEARLGKLTGDAKKNLSSEEKANLLRDMADCHAEIERAERCLREPAWSTEQATKEAIESLIATATHETLASLSAEARGAVDVLMGRYREATDESIFLAGYSGDPVKVHRKGSPPVILARPCLSLLWMLQPDKLRELLESPAMSESGLLPRFLLADTKAEPQEEPEDWPVLSEATADKWRQLVLALVDEYREVDVAARVVTPERQAAALLRNYTNETAVRRRKGGDLEDVDIFAARWAENAWRLAVVLHAAERGDDAWRESLSVDTAERALCLMRWFAGQQLALLAAGREEKMKKRLERLQEVLKLKPEERCNLSELERRHAFTAAEVERLANKFPAVLVIERITTGGAGRPPLVARLLPIQKGKK